MLFIWDPKSCTWHPTLHFQDLTLLICGLHYAYIIHLGSQNGHLGSQIIYLGSPNVHLGFQIMPWDSKSCTWDTTLCIWDSTSCIWDPKIPTWDSTSCIWNPKSHTWGPTWDSTLLSRIPNMHLGSHIMCLGSHMMHLGSHIMHLGSHIVHLESHIVHLGSQSVCIWNPNHPLHPRKRQSRHGVTHSVPLSSVHMVTQARAPTTVLSTLVHVPAEGFSLL